MLLFLLPLKSKKSSQDWGQVEGVLANTLNSICNQSVDDYRVIVACHDLPSIASHYPQVRFIQVDYEPPEGKHYNEGLEDKWRKLRYCMVEARKWDADFIMFVDADDLVHCDLAKQCQEHPKGNGWILKTGYRYRWGSRWIEYTSQYNCGTNAIVAVRHVRMPIDVCDAERERCLLLTSGHTIIEDTMSKNGTPLEPLPFSGGVYVHEHGENVTQLPGAFRGLGGIKETLKRLPRMRYLGKRLRRDFALDQSL